MTADGDLFVYEYYDVFDYQTFVDKMAPLVVKGIELPTDDFEDEGDLSLAVETAADYTPEIEEMFERMGIRKLDGQRGFTFSKPFTYAEIVVSSGLGDTYYKYAATVRGSVDIIPHAAGKTV